MAGRRKTAGERAAPRQRRTAELLAREKARVVEHAEMGALYWPAFIGTPAELCIIDFLAGWTPEQVLELWQTEVLGLGIQLPSIVHTLQVCHPKLAARQRRGELRDCTAWWPRARAVKLRTRVLFWSERNPEANLIPSYVVAANHDDSKGPRVTADFLVAAGADVNRVGATLIAASLFSRAESSRGALSARRVAAHRRRQNAA